MRTRWAGDVVEAMLDGRACEVEMSAVVAVVVFAECSSPREEMHRNLHGTSRERKESVLAQPCGAHALIFTWWSVLRWLSPRQNISE